MEDQKSQFLNPSFIINQVDVNQGMQVGDLGCGSGYISFALASTVGEKGKVYSVDIQKGVLDQVKKEAQAKGLDNLVTIWSDLEVIGAAKIQNNVLDKVFLANILFQVEDKRAIFAEAKRMLKPEGNLIVVDWKKGDTAIGPHQEKRLDLANITQLAQESGLIEVKQIDAGKYHFGIVFKPV
jgi:ubiquinone/menaquinone biosynthesis C-methylase UbiE